MTLSAKSSLILGENKAAFRRECCLVFNLSPYYTLRRDDYLAVSSIDMQGIYLNTQLRTIYIDINIVEIDKGKDM